MVNISHIKSCEQYIPYIKTGPRIKKPLPDGSGFPEKIPDH